MTATYLVAGCVKNKLIVLRQCAFVAGCVNSLFLIHYSNILRCLDVSRVISCFEKQASSHILS